MKKTLNLFIVLLVLVLLGVGFLWYGYTIIQKLKITEEEHQSQLTEEKEKNDKLVSLRKTLLLAIKDREQLGKFLINPSEEKQIELLAVVEKLGSSTAGITLTTNSFSLVQSKPPTLHGEFGMSGTWEQIHHFLRLVEEFPTRVVINRYEVRLDNANGTEKQAADKSSGSISIDFTSLKQP